MVQREVQIVNKLGLHARAAAKFVNRASGFVSDVRIATDGDEVDAKSILGLLLLAAAQGTTIVVSCDGPDEDDALAQLAILVENGFEEESS